MDRTITWFEQLSVPARTIWAKSGTAGGHGLLTHMLDVAAVAEVILRREPSQTRAWAARSLGLPVAAASQWLAAIVGLHDFGKAIPGFQCKWPEGKARDEQAGLGFKPASLGVHRHDLASAALLRRQLAATFPNTSWTWILSLALGAHHGYMPRSRDVQETRPRNEGPEWAKARAEILDAYLTTLSPWTGPLAEDLPLPAVAWFAGLTSIADWVGSNLDWFPLGERADSLGEHYEKAKALAETALDDIGWPAYRTLLNAAADTDRLIGRILGQPNRPVNARPLQQTADRLLERAKGPVLMIVEAPMGEGKTELALLAHLRLQALNGHRGLYLALPTQATGNAMFDRALSFLQGFDPSMRLDIQLIHGAAMLDERIHRLRGIDASHAESIASSAWLSQRKRPLISAYGVGTVDQALFATLNVKHHFVRLWGLTNRVVVLDEIHAYDTYTSGLIEALLRWLKGLGCSVILMSATLPAPRRASLLDAWGASDRPEIPYPRVLMAQEGETLAEHVECRQLSPIQVSGLSEDLEVLADQALSCLEAGGCGLVIVNTVQRAQDLYRLLREPARARGELLLFHARFPADERAAREQAVLKRFGPPPASRPRRCLLIATQVVEQSLDLDFDFMFSDLAPVDLLLQRAGRLHRHERERPAAHAKPHLRIAGRLSERPPELNDTAWGFVYDPYVLYCTWSVLIREPEWRLPEDIDRLVQAVYSGDPFEEEMRPDFMATLDQALGDHYAETQNQRLQAQHAAIDAEAEPQNAYDHHPRGQEERDGDGIPLVTRLGDDSVPTLPVRVTGAGWHLTPDTPAFDPHTVPDDDLARRIFARQVRLSRKGVVQDLFDLPLPRGFEEHPLLRHLRPMPLTDGVTDLGGVHVSLDTELGIVYEKTAPSSQEAT
ncbi:CRISPR-associated helicase Cas3' [Thiorhodococcus mannitoliphagus]|uniref:CRISPR-associated helicase Cas3 n=1 Tax=Thiorhodococcus mannitoliphagus TaxID=329406 RepID=A0A6P1E3G0_9GAMM|nr:CRISPR-associated helicase Cas3' [Thiorhodococcus mannitoliphagus]NEX23032.1 CRISPR-associated helicase Cas3' [Thiorhodococcus mannitoliphagus]